ncbi:hypothetical protein LCGC14_2314940, partial [marine sediment metagenome]
MILTTWEHFVSRSDSNQCVRILSGRVVIQCATAPDGKYFGPGDSGYFVPEGSLVRIMALEDSE